MTNSLFENSSLKVHTWHGYGLRPEMRDARERMYSRVRSASSGESVPSSVRREIGWRRIARTNSASDVCSSFRGVPPRPRARPVLGRALLLAAAPRVGAVAGRGVDHRLGVPFVRGLGLPAASRAARRIADAATRARRRAPRCSSPPPPPPPPPPPSPSPPPPPSTSAAPTPPRGAPSPLALTGQRAASHPRAAASRAPSRASSGRRASDGGRPPPRARAPARPPPPPRSPAVPSRAL